MLLLLLQGVENSRSKFSPFRIAYTLLAFSTTPPSPLPWARLECYPSPLPGSVRCDRCPRVLHFGPKTTILGAGISRKNRYQEMRGVRYLLEKLGSLLESGHSCFSTILDRVSFTHNWVASFVLSKTQNIILLRNSCTSFPTYFVYTERIGKYDENRAKAFSCPPYVHFSKLNSYFHIYATIFATQVM